MKLKCPECGRVVEIIDDSLTRRGADTARLAHATCCCYAASMPTRLLLKLIVAVLTADNNADDRPDEPMPAGSNLGTHI